METQTIHRATGDPHEPRSLCGSRVALPNGDDVTTLTHDETRVTCRRCAPFRVSVTFGHINPKPGFVSAYDAAAAHYELETGKPFAELRGKADYIRQYVNREVSA